MSGTISNSSSTFIAPVNSTSGTFVSRTSTLNSSTSSTHLSQTSVRSMATSTVKAISSSQTRGVISTSKSLVTFATKSNSTEDTISTETPVSNTTIPLTTSRTETTENVITSSGKSTSVHSPSVSRVTSVVTQQGPILSLTTTVTNQPESTFSTPIPITVVDPSNGKSSLSIPAVITVFSTKSESDGSLVTVTNVIANPTGLIGGDPNPRPGPRPSSFLNDGGKVAGVFVVIGVVAATLFLFTCLAFRRRRKRSRQRRRWLAGIQKPLPLPPNPFEDPREPPMTQVDLHTHNYNWDQHHDVFTDKEMPTHPQDGVGTGLGLTGLEARKFEGPFSDVYACDLDQIGLAISTSPDAEQSRRSLAQSSPSLYPPTLPADDESVHEDVNIHELAQEPTGSCADPVRKSGHVPPRPPRSHLRSPVLKNTELYPLTPPASVSSHEHSPVSKPPSPELSKLPPSALMTTGNTIRYRTSQDDILARPTLLDVRHKSGAE